MSTVFKKLPGVLALQKLLVISDGEMKNLVKADGETTEAGPVQIIRHGIRATQNMSGPALPKEVSNIQEIESAKTSPDAHGISVQFSIGVLPLNSCVSSCAGTGAAEIRTAINDFAGRAGGSDGLTEVSNRIARNILNGSWLWRNRVLADSLKVTVFDEKETITSSENGSRKTVGENDYSKAEIKLGGLIAGALAGAITFRATVRAEILFGFTGAVEVYPSQNYLPHRTEKGPSRSLYKLGIIRDGVNQDDVAVVGNAAIRDQKIGNALRTIDTWYPEYAERAKPIPVEPLGANLDAQEFFRPGKSSSFTLMKSINGTDPSSDDGMFLIASLIRGGVYSESDKAEKAAKKAKQEAEEAANEA